VDFVDSNSKISGVNKSNSTINQRGNRFVRSDKCSLFDSPHYVQEPPSAASIANSLKEDIYAKNCFGLPTTGEDFENHIKMINADNVFEVLALYKDISSNFILGDIIEEIGLSKQERNAYVKYIMNAMFDACEKDGIYVDDFRRSFNTDISNKKGLFAWDDLNKHLGALSRRTDVEYTLRGELEVDEYNKRFERLNDTPNGKIDKDFKQGNIGDCWLIAGLVGLANSPKGLQILNESLNVLPDGSVEVTLKGVNRKYVVTQEEIKKRSELAFGDADVRAIEVAMDRYLTETQNKGIDGGHSKWLFYAITGKGNDIDTKDSVMETFSANFKSIPDSTIDNFSKPNHIAEVSSRSLLLKHKKAVTDANGSNIELYYGHAYIVKSSDKDNVYLINPYEPEKTIALSREVFKDFFEFVQEFDL